MCTLSVFPNEEGVIVTMNRDERRTREEAENLFIADTYCFPVDVISQGTWIGMNDHGLVCALLNRYQDPHSENAQKSRGVIIPKFLQSTDLAGVQEQVKQLDFSFFNPFDLLIVNSENIVHVTWNGEISTQRTQPLKEPFFITSSSERTADILQYRHDVFTAFLDGYEGDENSVISSLHLKSEAGKDSDSIFMNRKKTHTKSMTQIVLKSHQIKMSYWPEDKIQSVQNFLWEHSTCHEFSLTYNASIFV